MRGIQLAALSISGLLAGNELGTLIGVHPALQRLPLDQQVRAEQAVTRRLGSIMPVYTTATMVTVAAAAVDRWRRPGSSPTLWSAGAVAAMLAVTGLGNIPLNTRTLAFPADGDAASWAAIRRRWERLHAVRVALDLTAFGCLARAALNPGPSDR